MQLPRKYHNRVLYALERTKALRSGEIDADPRWLQCIDRVLADVPDEGMRAFFDQFFQEGAELRRHPGEPVHRAVHALQLAGLLPLARGA